MQMPNLKTAEGVAEMRKRDIEGLEHVLEMLRTERAANPQPPRRYRWQYQNSNFGMGL